MKLPLFSLAALVLMGTTATAHPPIRWPCGSANIDQDSTWEEIDQSLAVKGNFPMVQIKGHFMTVDWLCHLVSDDHILSQRAVDDCLTRELNERGDCLQWTQSILSVPRVSPTRTIALEYLVDVVTESASASCTAKLFTKKFEIQKCQE